jgi:hypothetical protein
LEADIPASCTDSLFSKPPQSGMAEEQPVVAIALTVSKVSIAEHHDSPVSRSGLNPKLKTANHL